MNLSLVSDNCFVCTFGLFPLSGTVRYSTVRYAFMAISTFKRYQKANRTVPLFEYPLQRFFFSEMRHVRTQTRRIKTKEAPFLNTQPIHYIVTLNKYNNKPWSTQAQTNLVVVLINGHKAKKNKVYRVLFLCNEAI